MRQIKPAWHVVTYLILPCLKFLCSFFQKLMAYFQICVSALYDLVTLTFDLLTLIDTDSYI